MGVWISAVVAVVCVGIVGILARDDDNSRMERGDAAPSDIRRIADEIDIIDNE